MLSKFIDTIVDLSHPVIDDVDCRPYSSKPLYPVNQPSPALLSLNTLTGFAGYIYKNIDNLSAEKLLIHVAGHACVRLYSSLLSPFNQRFNYIEALYDTGNRFAFDHYYPVEEFIIKLQSLFINDSTVDYILSIVGNLKDEAVKQVNDDGVTQTVSAKAGLAIVKDINIPNPVILRPYRTFLEIDQPESQFILRLKSGRVGGDLPTCALFEADGGIWRIAAVSGIYEWLSSKIKDIAIIW